jgi:hypothetical protein
MIARRADRPAAISLGEGEAYDAENRVSTSCVRWTRRRMLQNTCGRSAAIDERTTRQAGYAVSPRIRKRIEQAFGKIKTVARKTEDQLPRP